MTRSTVALLALAGTVLTACSSAASGHGSASAVRPAATRHGAPPSSRPSSTQPGSTSATGGPFGASAPDPGPSAAGSSTAASSSAPPSTTATEVSSDPGIFVGTWSGHGRSLVVQADGTANVDYRVYRTCGQDAPPCDRIVGNAIIDGGHVTLQTVQVVTAHHASTLSAVVRRSTDPTYPVGSTQNFALHGDIIDSPWASFCDARSDGQCGA